MPHTHLVPLLIESFPSPPTHIPASPLPRSSSPFSINPPPSRPPSTPLPPVPGPSPISDHESIRLLRSHRLSTYSTSNSDNGYNRRDSVASYSSQNSFGNRSPLDLQSIDISAISRVSPLPPLQDEPEESVDGQSLLAYEAPEGVANCTSNDDSSDNNNSDAHAHARAVHIQIRANRSKSSSHKRLLRSKSIPKLPSTRSPSPDIDSILAVTPRPRTRSSARSLPPAKPRARWSDLNSQRWAEPTPADDTNENEDEDELALLEKQLDGSDSDSSLDLHTPLTHILLRHGVLSPHSKILPQPRPGSTASFASNTSKLTKSGLLKDERDTPQRRVRHRDGKTLKGGIGLTTGLGWSDSEDEDAPSPLTRRISSLNLSRRPSAASLPSTSSAAAASAPPTSWSTSSKARVSVASTGSLTLSIPRVSKTSAIPSSAKRSASIPATPTRHPYTPSTASTSSASIPLPSTPGDDISDDLTISNTVTLRRDKTLPPLPSRSLRKYPSSLALRSRTYSNSSFNTLYTPPPLPPSSFSSSSFSTSRSLPRELKLAQRDRPAVPVPVVKSRLPSQGQPPTPTSPPSTLKSYPSMSSLPKPRTGTGMVYRTSSVKGNKQMRLPSATNRP